MARLTSVIDRRIFSRSSPPRGLRRQSLHGNKLLYRPTEHLRWVSMMCSARSCSPPSNGWPSRFMH